MLINNFEFKKTLGQNFLNDKNVIHKIVDKSEIDKNTVVVEIGPGSGAITELIVPKAKYTILYEIDDRLRDNLNELLANDDNYEINIKDFLTVNLKKEVLNKINDISYKKFYVISNLPYYITTPIIMKFIDEDVLPDKFVVMMQKEVGDRLSAKPQSTDYGALTVLLNYYYDIKKMFEVSRNCFMPKPNVDSVVIEMDLKKQFLEVRNMNLFKRLVRDSFKYKRKTLRNNLKGYDLEVVESVLVEYGFNLGVRAEQLSVDIFAKMANALDGVK